MQYPIAPWWRQSSGAEALVYEAVMRGDLVIEEDGSIWRVGKYTLSKGRRSFSWGVPCRADKPTAKGYRLIRATVNGVRRGCGAHRVVVLHATQRPIHTMVARSLTEAIAIMDGRTVTSRCSSCGRTQRCCCSMEARLSEHDQRRPRARGCTTRSVGGVRQAWRHRSHVGHGACRLA